MSRAWLLGGCDPWQVDLAAAALMGLPPAQVPYLAAAQRRGLCGDVFDPAQLAPGSDPIQPIPGWKLPESFSSLAFADKFPSGCAGPSPLVTPPCRSALGHPPRQMRGLRQMRRDLPGHTIAVRGGKAKIDPSGCIRCFCCHEMCPAKAIDVRRIPFFNL